MLIKDAFPSSYLKASDLREKTVTVNIEYCKMENFGGDSKPVLYFQNREKGMVLNRTNTEVIVEKYGEETDHWHSKPLELFTARVSFQGRMVDGLRVRISASVKQEFDDISF